MKNTARNETVNPERERTAKKEEEKRVAGNGTHGKIKVILKCKINTKELANKIKNIAERISKRNLK